MSTGGKIAVWTGVIAALALAVFIYFRFCFVYAEGVNEGDINYFQREGFIFKTYEEDDSNGSEEYALARCNRVQ